MSMGRGMGCGGGCGFSSEIYACDERLDEGKFGFTMEGNSWNSCEGHVDVRVRIVHKRSHYLFLFICSSVNLFIYFTFMVHSGFFIPTAVQPRL